MKRIFLILFLILMGAGTVQAIELTVCSFGCDYTTDGTNDEIEIQYAIDNATTGDTVRIFAGTYNLSINQTNISLTNSDIEGSTVNTWTKYHLLIINRSGITIEGNGSGSTILNFTSISASNNVSGLLAKNSPNTILKNYSGYMDASMNDQSSNMHYNHFFFFSLDSKAEGLDLRYAPRAVMAIRGYNSTKGIQNISIWNNNFTGGNENLAISRFGGSTTYANFSIRSNTFNWRANGQTCLKMEGTGNPKNSGGAQEWHLIENNTFYDCPTSIQIYSGTANSTIANNTVINGGNEGILFQAGVPNHIVRGNNISLIGTGRDDQSGGIASLGDHDSYNISIYENIINGGGGQYGIHIDGNNVAGPAKKNITFNTILNSYIGILVNGSFGLGDVNIQNNIINQSLYEGMNTTDTLGNISCSHNLFYSNNPNYTTNANCSNSIDADPLFVSAINFNLTVNSPARNNASDGRDIGALQYQTPVVINATTDGFYTQVNSGSWNYSVLPYVNFTGSPGSWINISWMAHNTTFDTNSSMVNHSAQISVVASITSVINSIQQIPYKIYERVSS